MSFDYTKIFHVKKSSYFQVNFEKLNSMMLIFPKNVYWVISLLGLYRCSEQNSFYLHSPGNSCSFRYTNWKWLLVIFVNTINLDTASMVCSVIRSILWKHALPFIARWRTVTRGTQDSANSFLSLGGVSLDPHALISTCPSTQVKQP